MYALRVSFNGGKPVIAGAEDLGTLSLHVSGGGLLDSKPLTSRNATSPQFHCSLSGLTQRTPSLQDERLFWVQRNDLKLGDVVEIEIVEVDLADSVASNSTTLAADSEEKEYFEHVKRDYLRLLRKYEPNV